MGNWNHYSSAQLLSIGVFFGIICGFVLCILSSLADVGAVPVKVGGVEKEVGFWYALNWSGNFLILYPIFLMIFGFQIRWVRGFIRDLSTDGLIFTRAGDKVSQKRIESSWYRELNSASIIFVLLAIFCTFQALTDWWSSAGRLNYEYLMGNHVEVTDEPRDWSIAHVFNINLPEKDRIKNVEGPSWGTFLFVLFAYIYMGITLFLYLSALVYSSVFAWFVHKFNSSGDNKESHLFLYRHAYLLKKIKIFLYQVFWIVFLGLLVMLLMRIQVSYLSYGGEYESLNDFLFSQWENVYDRVLNDASPSNLAAPIIQYEDNTSNFTMLSSIALGCFAMVALIFVFYSIPQALVAAQRAVLAKADDKEWLRKRDIELSEISPDFILTVPSAIKALVPEWRSFLAMVILVWLSALFPQIGILLVTTCVVTFVVSGQRFLKKWSTYAVTPDHGAK